MLLFDKLRHVYPFSIYYLRTEGKRRTALFTLIIGDNDAGQRLDKFLLKTLVHCPKSLLYKANRQKKIKVNRKRVELSAMLQPGDQLDLYLPDEFDPAQQRGATAETLPAAVPPLPADDIVYEDDHLLVVNKPVGTPAHSEQRGACNLRDQVLCYLMASGSYRPQRELSFVPALANRLDCNTQGLVLVGKTAPALRELCRLIREDRVQKRYLCLVSGVPQPGWAVLTGYLRKDRQQNRSEILDEPVPGAKKVVTEYRVLRQLGGHAEVEVTLHTGRSHQIRAQMAAIGHPILGDKKYGGQHPAYRWQALCAYRLQLQPEPDSILSYLSGREFAADPWFAE